MALPISCRSKSCSTRWIRRSCTNELGAELRTTAKARDRAGDLVEHLTAAVDELGVTVRIVPPKGCTYGEAKGICEQLRLVVVQPLVEVRDRETVSRSHPPSREFFCHVYEFLLSLPAIQLPLEFKQLEDTVLHPAEGILFVPIHPLENVE